MSGGFFDRSPAGDSGRGRFNDPEDVFGAASGGCFGGGPGGCFGGGPGDCFGDAPGDCFIGAPGDCFGGAPGDCFGDEPAVFSTPESAGLSSVSLRTGAEPDFSGCVGGAIPATGCIRAGGFSAASFSSSISSISSMGASSICSSEISVTPWSRLTRKACSHRGQETFLAFPSSGSRSSLISEENPHLEQDMNILPSRVYKTPYIQKRKRDTSARAPYISISKF